MNVEHIVKYFGGTNHLARIAGCSRSCIWKWRKQGDACSGISAKYRRRIMRYARTRNIDFRESDFDDPSRIQARIDTAPKKFCVLCRGECESPVMLETVPWVVNGETFNDE